MEYMILIHVDESHVPATPGSPEFDEQMGEWFAYNQKLIDGGHWVAGASLQPTLTATLLTKSGDTKTITDGPYAETKEQVAGFYLIKASDLDEALALAEQIPLPYATFEVRPIA
ncbi:MAG: hypothetical protein JWP10_31, partial [Nocardioidaceae bacterium]|nr:hypothetical protein [Nocardioidaceae bacterium]